MDTDSAVRLTYIIPIVFSTVFESSNVLQMFEAQLMFFFYYYYKIPNRKQIVDQDGWKIVPKDNVLKRPPLLSTLTIWKKLRLKNDNLTFKR